MNNELKLWTMLGFKKEVKDYVFQINNNERNVLFNAPHMPNMISLSLTLKIFRDHVKIFRK